MILIVILWLIALVGAFVDYIQRTLSFRLDYLKATPSEVESRRKSFDRAIIIGYCIQLILIGLGAVKQISEDKEANEDRVKLNELREMAKSNPSLPLISLRTQKGLPHPWPYTKEVGVVEHETFRYHILEVLNTNKVNLSAFRLELLLPEPVYQFYETQSTAGVTISILTPPRGLYQGTPINGGSAKQMGNREELPIRHLNLETAILPADGFIRLHILSFKDKRVPLLLPGIEPTILLQGEFKYTSDNRVNTMLFNADFRFDWTNRIMFLGPARVINETNRWLLVLGAQF